MLDKSKPGGGLVVEKIQAAGGASGSAPPFNRASVGLRITAKAVVIGNHTWPTVNCTSMESGCHDCVGPIPSSSVVDDSVASAGNNALAEVTLLPFGATDVRWTHTHNPVVLSVACLSDIICCLPVVDVLTRNGLHLHACVCRSGWGCCQRPGNKQARYE